MNRFASVAKRQGIIIEVEKDGAIVRFYPDARPETAVERAKRMLDEELAAFIRKNGYEPLNPWDAARLDD